MSGGQPQPFRVLDLACGSGLLRLAVARRVPTRTIHYTGIDTSRFGLQRVESAQLQERFIHSELDLNDPEALTTQLAALLGRERFDEVHMHLLHPTRHGRQPTGPKVMRAIGKYLRPGGRLYHLFQNSSPLFDFNPARVRCSHKGPDSFARDEVRFRAGASQGGLVLDKCGCRWEDDRNPTEGGAKWAARKWMTRPLTGTAPDPHTADIYEQLGEQYSRFAKYASHFVILRKRKRRAPVRRKKVAKPRKWRARRGSNPQPPGSKPGALSD